MKFKNSNYDKESRISFVTIQEGKIRFTGEARCHPDDEPSEYAGCFIAELRATRKALLYKRRKEKEKAEECRKFVQSCEQCKDFDKESPSAKIMYKQLHYRIRKVNDITDMINQTEVAIKAYIIKRDKTQEYLKNKMSKKDN